MSRKRVDRSKSGSFVREVSLGDINSRRLGAMVNQLVAQRPGISLDSWLSAVGEAGRGLPV